MGSDDPTAQYGQAGLAPQHPRGFLPFYLIIPLAASCGPLPLCLYNHSGLRPAQPSPAQPSLGQRGPGNRLSPPPPSAGPSAVRLQSTCLWTSCSLGSLLVSAPSLTASQSLSSAASLLLPLALGGLGSVAVQLG